MRSPCIPWLASALLGGCFVTDGEYAARVDADGDGYVAVGATALDGTPGTDCDDSDPEVHPGMSELSCLDDVDSDCDSHPCNLRDSDAIDVASAWVWGTHLGARLRVMSAGTDVDGDGAADLVVMESPGADSGEPARVRRLRSPTDASASGTLESETTARVEVATELLAVSPVGDVDGDGDTDLALATRGDTTILWLLDDLSDVDRLDPDAPGDLRGLRVPTDVAAEDVLGLTDIGVQSGRAVGVGDWDGDGRLDFAFGAGGASVHDDSAEGAVFIVTDDWTGVEKVGQVAVTRIVGVKPKGGLGTEVVGGIDLDGGGLPDLIAFQPGYGAEGDGAYGARQAGASYGFTSTPAGEISSDDADVFFLGVYDNSRVFSPVPVGDIDQDGYDDVAIGVGTGSGMAALFYGPFVGSGVDPVNYIEQADHRIVAEESSDPTQGFGNEIAAPGDVDADGYVDLIVDAPAEGLIDRGDVPYQAGAVYLFHGPIEGVQSPDHARWRRTGATEGAEQSSVVLRPIDTPEGESAALLLLQAPGARDPARSDGAYGALFLLPMPG